jgi:L-lysine 2,3-aminomutase
VERGEGGGRPGDVRPGRHRRDELACETCGERRPPCLDFHHPDEKDLGVAEMVAHGYANESIREEIDRCEVLCANCHRVHHHEPPDTGSTASQSS